jgi:multimeric flavodoxin WrbA
MQVFIEKAGVGHMRFNRPLANKLGGVVVVGRRYSQMAVYEQITSNLLLNRMIIVGSGFPAVLNGGEPGSVLKDTEGVASVIAMVDRMIDFHRTAGAQSSAVPTRSANERTAILARQELLSNPTH